MTGVYLDFPFCPLLDSLYSFILGCVFCILGRHTSDPLVLYKANVYWSNIHHICLGLSFQLAPLFVSNLKIELKVTDFFLKHLLSKNLCPSGSTMKFKL